MGYFILNNNYVVGFVDVLPTWTDEYVETTSTHFDFKPGHQYTIKNGVIDELALPETILLKVRENRQVLVDSIEVEYNGVVYQGDETSQDRLNRNINVLSDTNTIKWKAKDNSSHELTKEDLKQILFLASQEQTKIWFT